MLLRRLAIALGALLITAAPLTRASATGLLPGGSVVPGTMAGEAGGSILASLTTAFSLTNASSVVVLTGTLRVAVYKTAGGTLDFLYQVTNDGTSSDDIGRISMADFKGFTTDVTSLTSLPAPAGPFGAVGTAAPSTADRNASGKTVGFNLTVTPGSTSKILVISTNATAYKPGTVNVIDDGVVALKGFAPVPEISSLASFAGLLGLGAFALRRKSRAS